jgi:hypothetical protein
MAKKISIMQPYLFPYLGYFQMISAVDTFVLYDDVQFIEGGWINRNKILINGNGALITFPIKKAEYSLNINERYFSEGFLRDTDKLLRSIYLSYVRAPCFKEVFPLLQSIIKFPERNVAIYTENIIRKICDYLDISTEILVSSKLKIGTHLRNKHRVMEIVKVLGGEIAINPIGSVELYSCAEFLRNGITLKFIRMHDVRYRQYSNSFVPRLSIIDVLMFNSLPEVKKKLSLYSLEDNFGNQVFPQCTNSCCRT